jgi:hypothetical protein
MQLSLSQTSKNVMFLVLSLMFFSSQNQRTRGQNRFLRGWFGIGVWGVAGKGSRRTNMVQIMYTHSICMQMQK